MSELKVINHKNGYATFIINTNDAEITLDETPDSIDQWREALGYEV